MKAEARKVVRATERARFVRLHLKIRIATKLFQVDNEDVSIHLCENDLW
jgi:hypothetical protein